MDDHTRGPANAFPSAEDMRAWHAMTPEEQRADLKAALLEGLNGPTSGVTTADEIMAMVLARYAVEA